MRGNLDMDQDELIELIAQHVLNKTGEEVGANDIDFTVYNTRHYERQLVEGDKEIKVYIRIGG